MFFSFVTLSGQHSRVFCAAHRPQKTPLNSIIYPAIGKLLQANQGDDAVVMCLAQLKVAFDNAEKVKPGISHAFVAYLIETIRAFVSTTLSLPFSFFRK